MNTDKYLFWPIEIKRNRALIGKHKGHIYWRFGFGARWEHGWNGRQDEPGSKRLLGWSFFVGPIRLIFGGKTNRFAELYALMGRKG